MSGWWPIPSVRNKEKLSATLPGAMLATRVTTAPSCDRDNPRLKAHLRPLCFHLSMVRGQPLILSACAPLLGSGFAIR